MDIQHGLTVRNGTEYTFKLLESAMNKVLDGTGYTFKGMWDSKNTYNTNDVVFYQNKGTGVYDIYYCYNAPATGVWSGSFWKKYDYKFANTDKVNEKDSELDTLIKTLILALTGSTNYKGAFDAETQYAAGDVIITVLNGVVTLLKATKANKGVINFDNWEILKLMSEKEMIAYSGGGPYANVSRTYDINIVPQQVADGTSVNHAGWVAIGPDEMPGYNYRYQMRVPYIKSGYYFVLMIEDEDSMITAMEANIMPAINVTSNGTFRMYATNRPKKIIKCKLIFLNSINGADSAKIPDVILTLKQENWSNTDEVINFSRVGKNKNFLGRKQVVSCPEVKENYIPCVIISQETCTIAERARLLPTVHVEDGKLTFYSETTPINDIECKIVFVNVIGSDTFRKIKTTYEHNFESSNSNPNYSEEYPRIDTMIRYKPYFSNDFREAYYGQIIFDPVDLDDVVQTGMHRYAWLHDGMIETYYANYSGIDLPGTVVIFNTTDGLVENTNVTVDISGLNVATNEEVWGIINEILGKN